MKRSQRSHLFLPIISYTDRVYAAYSTYSSKIKENFGFQLGLRLESSDYSGTMHSSVQDGAGFKDTSARMATTILSVFSQVFFFQKN